MPRIILLMALSAATAVAAPLAGPPARTPGGITEPGVRKTAVLVGVTGSRHSLKGSDNELLGSAGAIQIGTGYIDENWYASLSLDVVLGPFEPTLGNQLNVDYSGTGLTLWTGVSAQTMNLRSPEGGYGFALGLSYMDIIGRSVGKNRKMRNDQKDGEQELIDNYIMRVNSLAVIPALFFSWLAPPRPRGNTPELLTTRIDGYFLTIGGALPLLSHYNARYERLKNHTHKTSAATDGNSTQMQDKNTSTTEKGALAGYSIIISFTAMLGT